MARSIRCSSAMATTADDTPSAGLVLAHRAAEPRAARHARNARNAARHAPRTPGMGDMAIANGWVPDYYMGPFPTHICVFPVWRRLPRLSAPRPVYPLVFCPTSHPRSLRRGSTSNAHGRVWMRSMRVYVDDSVAHLVMRSVSPVYMGQCPALRVGLGCGVRMAAWARRVPSGCS